MSVDKLQSGTEAGGAELLRLARTTPAQTPSLGPPFGAAVGPAAGLVVGKGRFVSVLELLGWERPLSAQLSPPVQGQRRDFGSDVRQRREKTGGSLTVPGTVQSFSVPVSFLIT